MTPCGVSCRNVDDWKPPTDPRCGVSSTRAFDVPRRSTVVRSSSALPGNACGGTIVTTHTAPRGRPFGTSAVTPRLGSSDRFHPAGGAKDKADGPGCCADPTTEASMPNVNDRAIVLRIGSSSVGDKTLIPRCGCAQVDVSELLETQGRNVACPCRTRRRWTPAASIAKRCPTICLLSRSNVRLLGLQPSEVRYRDAKPCHNAVCSPRRGGGRDDHSPAAPCGPMAQWARSLVQRVGGPRPGPSRSSDLLLLAVPPILGGMLVVFWPATNGGIAGASGLLAAFLDVWPVYQFPGDLLDDDLLQFWPTLKILNGLFVGMSAALTYLGFIVVDRIVPVSGTLSRARAWQRILDGMSASARFGPLKYALATLLVLGGLYFNRERARIGARATTHCPPQA